MNDKGSNDKECDSEHESVRMKEIRNNEKNGSNSEKKTLVKGKITARMDRTVNR